MKSIPEATEDFFKAGGALDADAPSYVVRRADGELLQAVQSGQYCNVLTARQMGKSSLMVRIVRRLQDAGVRTVTIDLTGLGTRLSPSEWYFGLVSRFKRQLGLRVDEAAWWREREQLGAVQRFSDFLRQVVLEEVEAPVVVFIDEIDSTLSLPFTDDFFAAIRAAYNARASDPAYQRLTFVLLGVARPSDLIKDRTRSPYNIGTSIDLTDFTLAEAQVLLAGLAAVHPDQAAGILARVLHWTGGHPYLTQKVCAEVVTRGDQWSDERIDELVEQLFLAAEARKETNLQFIRDQLRESAERAGMLRLYRRVWAGQRVADEERSVAKSRLKLAGLVKPTADGRLIVRNRIYERVFDRQWVRETMPVSPAQRVALVMAAVALLAVAVVGYLIYRQQTMPAEIRAELYRENFASATSPEVQLSNLAGLFGLAGYEDEARDLFFSLEAAQRLALFAGLGNPSQVGPDALVVVAGVYQDARLENNAESNRLLRAMVSVLQPVEGTEVSGAEATAMELDYWVTGREQALAGDYGAAVEQYTLALGLNEENVAVLLDRGQAYAALGEYQDAMADSQAVIRLDPTREEAVRQFIEQDSSLFTYVGLHRPEYPAIAAWFSPLTPTPTLTPTSTPTPIPTLTLTPTSTPTPTPTTPTPRLIQPIDTLMRTTDGMVMVYVPAGEFEMGSNDGESDEQEVHTVALNAFWLDQTEVNVAQFRQFVRATQYTTTAEREGWAYVYVKSSGRFEEFKGADWQHPFGPQAAAVGDNHPVTQVSWDDAAAYCEWAGGQLPTEAQWEYAARGPESRIYPWGDQWQNNVANCGESICKDGFEYTAPVGSFLEGASWVGALDLAGNVWEWTADWYGGSYAADRQENPTGPTDGDSRVMRGGSWYAGTSKLYCANRSKNLPADRFGFLGFRCARTGPGG